ncbi:MAG: AAA family ATPase [bacterium]|nr:AAA family ATPase [bacterium]
MNKKLLSLFGLKWNPFAPGIPTEAMHITSKMEHFCWSVESHLIRDGGFALITGDPGSGKSVAMRLLADRLGRVGEVTVASIDYPQSGVPDFYRELGDLFGVQMRPHNRWSGFKALRERWQAHIESTMIRPVLLIDEAQQMNPVVLSELRILSSTHFDSRIILSIVLAGDGRLTDNLRREELLPLGSRVRTRLSMDPASRDELLACLQHLTKSAGNASLMTKELMNTLCEHSAGNHRVLTNIAGELLAVAAHRESVQIDEKLFFELYPSPGQQPKRSRRKASS